MGRGLGWGIPRGPLQPLPCWDPVYLKVNGEVIQEERPLNAKEPPSSGQGMHLTTHMRFLHEETSFPIPRCFQKPPGPFFPAFLPRITADPTLPAPAVRPSALPPYLPDNLPVLRPLRASLVRRGRRGQRISPSLLLFTLALPLRIPLSAQDGVLRSRSLILVAGCLSPTVGCLGKGVKGREFL